MKILVFTEAFWPHLGGIETFVETLISQLIYKHHECWLITSCLTDTPNEAWYKGIRIFRLPLRQGLNKNITAYRHSLEKIKAIKLSFNPDIYHLNVAGPCFFYHLQTLNISKAPTVFTFHYLLDHTTYNANNSKNLLKKILDVSDAITAGSNITLNKLHTVLPEYHEKSHLIRFGLESPPIPMTPVNPQSKIILSWGRLVQNKGFEYVLYALSEIRKDIPDIQYYLIGDGPDKGRLKTLITDLNLEKNVVFPQRSYSREELFHLLTLSRIVINPSHDTSECFGLVALEAMQMARPVLTTKHVGLNELVIDGRTGMTFDFGNLSDLKQKLRLLLQNHAIAAQIAYQGYRHSNKFYSLTTMVEAYELLFKNLIFNHQYKKQLKESSRETL